MDTATSAMVSYGIVVDLYGFVNIFLQFYTLFYRQESGYSRKVGCIFISLCYNDSIPIGKAETQI